MSDLDAYFKNIEIQRCIGKGSMGRVMLGKDITSGELIAVKVVKKKETDEYDVGQPFEGKKRPDRANRNRKRDEIRELRTIREAHIMMLLKHPNIIRLRRIFSTEESFLLSMDYIDGGQLMRYIAVNSRLTEEHARHLSRQILSAIDYLHRNSIVHRDLKIENILIDHEGQNIKVIDFGLSNLFSPEKKLTTYCGSLYFAAPELLHGTPYSGPEVDVWSFGVVLYVMVTGTVPFDDMSLPALHDRIKRGQVAYPACLSLPLRNLFSRIFVTTPVRRIILQDVIRHPWVNEGYDEYIDHYVPERSVVELPLVERIIRKMRTGFNVGSFEDVTTKMGLILNSSVYRDAAKFVNSLRAACDNRLICNSKSRPYDDPQSVPSAYHPLISLYQLSEEQDPSDPKYTTMDTDGYSDIFRNDLSICSEGSLLQELHEGVNFVKSISEEDRERGQKRHQQLCRFIEMDEEPDTRRKECNTPSTSSFYSDDVCTEDYSDVMSESLYERKEYANRKTESLGSWSGEAKHTTVKTVKPKSKIAKFFHRFLCS